MNPEIWVVVLTGFSGLLGILLTQSYSKNANLRAELKNKKQKLYSEFIVFLYKIYSGTEEIGEDEVASKLKQYFPKLLTFASNEVIKNTGDFMQHIYKFDQEAADSGDATWNIQSMEYFGDLILAIRNDLGHKKFLEVMKWHDVARLWITDIDQYIPKAEQTPRSRHVGPSPKI